MTCEAMITEAMPKVSKTSSRTSYAVRSCSPAAPCMRCSVSQNAQGNIPRPVLLQMKGLIWLHPRLLMCRAESPPRRAVVAATWPNIALAPLQKPKSEVCGPLLCNPSTTPQPQTPRHPRAGSAMRVWKTLWSQEDVTGLPGRSA